MDYMFTTPNRAILNTPDGLPDIDILKSYNGYDKRRYKYPNGLILVIETIGKEFRIDSNYKWFKTSDNSFSPDYTQVNDDFADPRVL